MKRLTLILFAFLILIASSYLFTQTNLITDQNLEQVIKEVIGKTEGDITIDDLKRITYLNAADSDISNLEGLQYCEELIMIDLSYNDIEDISPLSGLPKVDYLNLGNNSIKDISSLSGYTSILTLNLSNNKIEDISPLSELYSLAYLYLRDNKIKDISSLIGLNLSLLNLEGNMIKDITPLEDMTGLSILNLNDNSIGNIEALSGLRDLSTLYLRNNDIEDISNISNLKNLEKLDLSKNFIRKIIPLSNLRVLVYLNLSYTGLDDISGLSRLTGLKSLILDGNSIDEIVTLRRIYTNGGFRSQLGDDYNIIITNNDMDIKPDTVNRQIVEELIGEGVSILWEDGNKIRIIFYDITGKITNTEGNPIPDAEVQVYEGTANLIDTIKTDPNGNYTINLSNGTYSINVVATGYDSKKGTIKVNKGRISGENIILTPTVYHITGQVFDEDNNKVVEAKVVVYDENGEYLAEMRTDENGEFIVNLTNGEYKVMTYAEGYDHNQSAILISDGILNKGKIILQKTVYTLEGEIKGKDGKVIKRATISIIDEDGNNIYNTTSSENGGYTLELKNGSYTIEVIAQSYKPLSKKINVRNGTLYGGKLSMERAEFTLSGKVLDEKGYPVAGAGVTVRNEDGDIVSTTQTNIDGIYSVSLPVGEYTVTIEAENFKKMDANFKIMETGEISGKETIIMEYLYDGGITGNIVNKNGEPVSNVMVTATDSNGNEYTIPTDLDGNYTIPNLPSSEYSIEMEHPDYIKASGKIKVVDEMTVFPQILFLLKSDRMIASLEGIIKDAQTGGGLAGIKVSLYEGFNNTSGNAVMSVSSVTSGEYDLSIESGYYTLVLSGSNVTDVSYNITITGDITRDFTISAKIDSGKVRIILTWGEFPEDLDSHLKKENNIKTEHIYYHNKTLHNGDNLDVDDTTSYGPETITFNLDKDYNYTYYVHDYINRDTYEDTTELANSGAKVIVIIGGDEENLTFEYNVPSKEGTVWKVFEIVNGEFRAKNDMYYVTEPSKIPLS